MSKGSNADNRSPEEVSTTDVVNDIFDDNQPMTYNNPEDDYLPGEVDVITSFDKDGDNQPSDDDDSADEETLSPSDPKAVESYRKKQSEADKSQAELVKLRKELETQKSMVEEYLFHKPVIDFLVENPDRIGQLVKMENQPPQAKPVEEELVAPQKPKDYDKFAAYNDPESESFKYREAVDDYRFKQMERMLEQADQKVKAYEERFRTDVEQRQQREQMLELHKALARDFQMGEAERVEFIKFSNDPEPELADLVSLFRTKNKIQVPDKPSVPPPKGQEFRSVAGASGTSEEKADENAQFVRSLRGGRTRNLFETL